MKKIRDYRVLINKAQLAWYQSDEQRARVYAPTGSGKTEMFLDLIRDVRDLVTNPKILVVHPRLALSTDQQKRFKSAFKGEEIEFTSVHSGTVEDTKQWRIAKSVNNAESLKEIISTRRSTHVTFTSYNSLGKIADLDFDLIICDESHYMVEKQNFRILEKFNSKTIFYTATPVGVEEDAIHTMDNVDLFGETIAEITPKEMIKKGYIVAPRLRIAHIDVEQDAKEELTLFTKPVETIAHAYVDQRTCISPKIKHKMLVAMPNIKMFDDIMNGLPTIRNITHTDIDVYFVSANRHVKNGVRQESRAALLEEFSKNPNEAIIVHCDTLAEGIDIDGITGAFMMRNLSKRKFGQTMGRCSRPLKRDLKDGEVKNMEKRLKPNSIITVPYVNGQPYCKDAKTFVDTFTLYGYGDIMDYIDPEFEPKMGGDDEDEKDDKKVSFAHILDFRVNETALEINKLFNIHFDMNAA